MSGVLLIVLLHQLVQQWKMLAGKGRDRACEVAHVCIMLTDDRLLVGRLHDFTQFVVPRGVLFCFRGVGLANDLTRDFEFFGSGCACGRPGLKPEIAAETKCWKGPRFYYSNQLTGLVQTDAYPSAPIQREEC